MKVLLRRVHNLLIRRRESIHHLGVGELEEDSIGEVAQTLVLFAAEDEDLVLEESRKTASVEGDAEVLGLGSQLFDDVVVEGRHAGEEGAQADVIVRLLLVLAGQFLAQRQGALPHLAAVKQVDAVQVERFFELTVSDGLRVA